MAQTSGVPDTPVSELFATQGISLLPGSPNFTYKSGAYVQGALSVTTSATLGNGSLRLAPVPVLRPITISAIGTEFTAAGDAASLLRMAVYSDDGTGYPASLLLDGGSISTGSGNAGTVATGGTPGVYMNTGITPLVLAPGLYWMGGAVQGVTVTQPTMRTALFCLFAAAGNTVPAAGASSAGYFQGSVTGSLPGSFAGFGSSAAGAFPRIVFKLQ